MKCSITEPTPSDAYQVLATYSGDVNFTTATQTIAPTPTVTITPSANPAISGPVVYSVSVTGTGPTPTGTVNISDADGWCTATLILGGGGCAITENAGNSPLTVTATYTSDSYYAQGQGTLTETVIPAVAKVVLSPSSNPANEGPVTYTVLVTGNGSVPTGSVTVSDGQGGSCTAELESGVGNCAVIETGRTSPFTITATYIGDPNYSGASATLTNARGVSTSPTGTALATLGGTTDMATGVGTVNILQYQSDPVGTPTFTPTGAYFDVASSAGNSFSSEVVQDCDLNGGGTLLWWNPTANSGVGGWQNVIGDPGPSYTAGPPACLSVTLDSTTSPSLSQLTGTVFGVASGSEAPSITSPNHLSVIEGSHLSFTVSAIGSPTPSLARTGTLPSGVTFTDNHNGTATLSGNLLPNKGGKYTLTFGATNTNGAATQTFTLSVVKAVAPKFITGATVKCLTGEPFTYTVETTGVPVATLSQTGSLPSGLTFTPIGNGAATVTGTPATSGTYQMTITANAGDGLTKAQVLTVVVLAGS